MTEQAPAISVVMSVFNGGRFLREAIESILRQTFRDFELIVIDDGSTDNSAQIISSFTDDRLRVITHTGNLGLITSLNRGLAEARGAFIARMDADDVAMPERFWKQIEAFRNDPGLSVCGCNYISRGRIGSVRSNAHGENTYLKSLLMFATCFSHPTVMIRRSALSGHSYDERARYAEDYKLWVDLSGSGGYLILQETLLMYRLHPQQVSQTRQREQKEISALIREGYLNKLGFSFTAEQLRLHHRMADNLPAADRAELDRQESWLLELLRQNEQKRIFDAPGFNRLIQKYWLDSCGNTGIGAGAYRKAMRSDLAGLLKVGAGQKTFLFLKCVYRGIALRKKGDRSPR